MCPPSPPLPSALHNSEEFKDSIENDITDQRVLVVGIGNSAVDTAVNLATCGRNQVAISTRSGAWIWSNYIFGQPTDHYACRLFLALPWRIST